VRTYWAFFRKAFKKHLAYRAEVWLRIIGGILSITVQVAIWRAVLGEGSYSGIDLADMVTYAIITTGLGTLLMQGLVTDADDRLRTGDIAVDLLKPLRYPLFLFADQLGRSAFQCLFTMVPTVAIAWLLFGFNAPASPVHALAFVLALVLALVISYAIGFLVALLAFWFLTTFHFAWAVGALSTAFAGTFLPLWFFPPGWEMLARSLPFQFMGFVPAATYMGELPGRELMLTLGLGLLWAATLLGAIRWLWSASIRRLVIQGG